MAGVDRTAQFDFAQGQRERHRCKRDQREHPERIHIGEERRLCLHLRSDPLDGLIVRLRQRAALGGKEARDLLQRILILRARRNHLLDKPALVKLLAMRQHVGDDGDADRAAGIARGVDQGRCLIGL